MQLGKIFSQLGLGTPLSVSGTNLGAAPQLTGPRDTFELVSPGPAATNAARPLALANRGAQPAESVSSLLKPRKGILASLGNWLAQRKFKDVMPTVAMGLDPKAPVRTQEDEIGLQERALNWPVMRSFDSGVFARFHSAETEQVDNASRYVSGGPSGQGRDSYSVTDRTAYYDGNVALVRRLTEEFSIHVMATSLHQSYTVPRGHSYQMAPDKVKYRRVEDRLVLRLTKQGDGSLSEEQQTFLQRRIAIAERLAFLRASGTIATGYDEGASETVVTQKLLEDLKGATRRGVSSFNYAVALQGGQYSYLQNAGINTFLAALVDVFSLSDQDLAWVENNLQ
jgi:hypothetical protein